MFFEEPFPIAQVFPTDLTRAGLTEEQIADLSYEDMRNIAHRLQQLYFAGPFLSHLAQVVNELFVEKEERTFPVASITRAEILRIGYSKDEVDLLTDSDLEKIAKLMGARILRDRLGQRLYDADLLQLAGIVIVEKEELDEQAK